MTAKTSAATTRLTPRCSADARQRLMGLLSIAPTLLVVGCHKRKRAARAARFPCCVDYVRQDAGRYFGRIVVPAAVSQNQAEIGFATAPAATAQPPGATAAAGGAAQPAL